MKMPRESGPRCTIAAHIRSTSVRSTGSDSDTFPAIPHIGTGSLATRSRREALTAAGVLLQGTAARVSPVELEFPAPDYISCMRAPVRSPALFDPMQVALAASMLALSVF